MIEAAADLDRVLLIDESKRELTLSNERIEKAIVQNGARLIILDPIQAYMGEKADMNKANEVRPIFRRLAEVAERTGCAVILIGHLNKAAGGQSAYPLFRETQPHANAQLLRAILQFGYKSNKRSPARNCCLKVTGKNNWYSRTRLYYLQGLVDRVIDMEDGAIQKELSAQELEKMSNQQLASMGLRPLRLEIYHAPRTLRRLWMYPHSAPLTFDYLMFILKYGINVFNS